MPPLAAGDCLSEPGHPLHSFCSYVDEHAGGSSSFAVAIISRVAWPLVVLVIAILVARIVRGIADQGVRHAGADPQIEALVHNVLVAVGVVAAIGAALVAAGLDLSIFLTIGGLGTLALSLAFQDLLRNVLAGIFLLVERPFRLGDVVTIDDLTGSVATIQLRTTALRLPDGKLAVVPNLDAFNKMVINLTAFETRQFSVSVWVPDGADLEEAIRLAREVLEATPEALKEPAPRVQPGVEIDWGVTLQLQYWLEYRATDPDAVAASIVRRLDAALAGKPPPDLARQPDPPAEEAAVEEEVSRPRRARGPRRARPA